MFTWLKKTFRQMVTWFRPEQATQVPPHDRAEKLSSDTEVSEVPPQHKIPPPPDIAEQSPAVWPTTEVFPRAPRGKWVKPKGPEKLQRKERDPIGPVKPLLAPSGAPIELAPNPEPETKLEHPQLSRTLRRRMSALERKRRKYDKFVEPQGTPPVHKNTERTAAPPKPKTAIVLEPAPEIPDAELHIVDTHFASDGEDVLYKEAEFYGEYNFRDSILDQLERYFVYLRRMKKNAPDVYGLYKEIGAILIPYASIMPDWATGCDEGDKRKPLTKMPELSPWFKKNRPAFGCFAYGSNPLAEKRELEASESERAKKSSKWIVVPKFMYFHKYRQAPPEVQPMSGGDIYLMSIWWDRPHDPDFKKKKAGPTEYAVFVSSDGTRLEILRTCKTKMLQVMAKRRKNKESHFLIPQRCWQIPKTFRDWADDYHEDVQVHLGSIFTNAMSHYETAQYSMVRIAARKADMTAVFSVNVRRMAYFFKDRDYVLTENGARKPVFHIVRAHERHTTTGTHAVKFHFRGEREFTWAGYQISITVPGRDHFMLPEFDVGVSDEYWIRKGEKTLGMAELGKKISGWIDSGRGGQSVR